MAKKSFKQFVISLPVIGYCARLVTSIAKLPKDRQTLVAFNNEIDQRLSQLTGQTNQLQEQLQHLDNNQDDLQQRFNLLERSQTVAPKKNARQEEGLFADDHIMDKFYTDFEDRFRGTEEMITKRLKVYLPIITQTKIDYDKAPVLDIGSGRGEFLELLKSQGIKAIGLDINIDMVERSKKKGLEAIEGDALSHLQAVKSQTYGAITGFHIVEHIPFNILLRIFIEARRALVPGGFVIFETPNPENVIVGTHNFYMDPSHLHPLPPTLLAFALETSGFKNVEIKRLHPDKEHKKGTLPSDVEDRFYGPRDYAVIAYR